MLSHNGMYQAGSNHGVWCIRPDGYFLDEVLVYSPSGGAQNAHIFTTLTDKEFWAVYPGEVPDNWETYRANLEAKGFTVLSDEPTEDDVDLVIEVLRERLDSGIQRLLEEISKDFGKMLLASNSEEVQHRKARVSAFLRLADHHLNTTIGHAEVHAKLDQPDCRC